MKIILLVLTVLLLTKVRTKSISQVNGSSDDVCSELYFTGRCSAECPCQKAGECCSSYGYCGATEDYCGKNTVTVTIPTPTTESTTTTEESFISDFPTTGGTAGIIVFLPNYQLYSVIKLLEFDFSKVDVVVYSFFRLSDDGEAYSIYEDVDFTNKNIYYLNHDVKKKYPNLRTVLSFGGGGGSRNFGIALNTEEKIKTAARSIIKTMSDNGFDGIDIDWEFPDNNSERASFATLLKLIRSSIGNDKILTLSAPLSSKTFEGYSRKYIQYVDWFNVMTYNFAGGWNTYTGHNSPLYTPDHDLNDQLSCDLSIKSYTDEGIPSTKLAIGAAFYGQAWKVISSTNNGFNQQGTTNIIGEPGYEAGVWTYSGLRKNNILSSYNSATFPWIRTWHSDAKSPTLFNPKTMEYISYDDPDSMCERVNYAKRKKLAGILMWEIGQDYKRELLGTIIDCYEKNKN